MSLQDFLCFLPVLRVITISFRVSFLHVRLPQLGMALPHQQMKSNEMTAWVDTCQACLSLEKRKHNHHNHINEKYIHMHVIHIPFYWNYDEE